MIKFIIKRLLALIPVLIGVTLLVYFILDLAPGDPAKTILGEPVSYTHLTLPTNSLV